MNTKRRASLSLDALTDILSNVVGMAILMCLVAALQRGTKVEKIIVPIQENTADPAEYFLVKKGRVLRVNLDELGKAIMASPESPLEVSALPGVSVNNGKDEVVLRVQDTASWTVPDRSWFATTIDRLETMGRFPYLFVHDDPNDSSELARNFAIVHEFERRRGRGSRQSTTTGWQPVNTGHPARFCKYTLENKDCDLNPQRRLHETHGS